MLPAKDRTTISRLPFESIGRRFLYLALASMLGCSQIRSFRQSESPKVGSTAGAAGDPYLASRTHAKAETSGEGASPDLQVSPRDSMAKADESSVQADNVRSTARPSPDRATMTSAEPGIAVRLEPPISSPTTPKPAEAGPIDARTIIAKSRAKLDTLRSYQVRLNRQERVGGSLQPPEDVLLSIRRDPKAVRLEWPTGPHKGREVLYSANDPSGMMHVNAADSVVPVPVLKLSPTSPLVMRNSRHPITEAGFDTILLNIEQHLSTNDSSSRNAYEGIETPPAVGKPCYKLTRVAADGERWLVYIDTRTAFPAMVEAKNPQGELLERYLFRDIASNPSELANNDAFDPDLRWGSSTGFLGRLARSAGGDANPTATPARR